MTRPSRIARGHLAACLACVVVAFTAGCDPTPAVPTPTGTAVQATPTAAPVVEPTQIATTEPTLAIQPTDTAQPTEDVAATASPASQGVVPSPTASGAMGTPTTPATPVNMADLEWRQVGLAGERLTTLEVLPGGPNLALVGGENGAWLSQYDYTQWQKQAVEPQSEARIGVVAIGSTDVMYFTSHTGCASALPSARSHTTDGGKTWTSMSGETFSLAAANTTTAYGTTCTGVVKTTDGGATWTALPGSSGANNEMLANRDPSDVVVSPDGNTLYAAYVSEGGSGTIIYSTDAGASWRDITPQVGADDVLQGPSYLTFITGSPGSPDDGGLYMTSSQGVWYLPLESTSGWKLIKKEGANSDPLQGPPYYHTAFAVDTAYSEEYDKPGPILYEARETFGEGEPKNLGVFRSTDGGATWQGVGKGLLAGRSVSSLALAPHDPSNPSMLETLLAATDDGVWALSIPRTR